MKKLLAAALILCMVGAWGSIAYRNIAVPNEYENNYAKAREAFEQGYYVETLNWLEEAEKIEDTYELECLKRDTYQQMGNSNGYTTLCRQLIQSHPEDVSNYEKIAQYDWDTANYKSLIKELPEYLGLFPESEVLKTVSEDLAHTWELVQRGYYDVVYATDASLKLYKEIQGDNEEEELDCVITDNAGNSIFDYGYRDAAVSQDGYSAMVCDQDGTWTNVNLSNQLLAKNEDRAYEKIGSLSAENIATAVLDGKYRFVNSELKMWDRMGRRCNLFEWNQCGLQGWKMGDCHSNKLAESRNLSLCGCCQKSI